MYVMDVGILEGKHSKTDDRKDKPNKQTSTKMLFVKKYLSNYLSTVLLQNRSKKIFKNIYISA